MSVKRGSHVYVEGHHAARRAGRLHRPLDDLAPFSRTASWQSYWPIKPDVVYEGGNWFLHCAPAMKHPALAPLTTDQQYPLRAFTTCGETSAATALDTRDITTLWSD